VEVSDKTVSSLCFRIIHKLLIVIDSFRYVRLLPFSSHLKSRRLTQKPPIALHTI